MGYCKTYIKGLLHCDHKKENLQVMAEKMDANYQGLHNFITNAPWDHQAVFDKTSQLTFDLFKKHDEPIILAVDETSFLKKGDSSVGVGTQYLGSEGKTANGQVVVFSALVQGTNCNLVQAELFVPEGFAQDTVRMKKAGLDASTFQFKTKNQLAKEQITHLISQNIIPDLIVADAAYGQDTSFRRYCRNHNLPYLLSVREGNTVWFEDPKDTKDTKDTKLKPTNLSNWVDFVGDETVVKTLEVSSNKSKKKATKQVVAMPIWSMDIATKEVVSEYLIILTDGVNFNEFKYFLTNKIITKDTIDEIAYLAGRRYFIERAFQDGKQLFGLAGYQIRKYRGMMHHLALVTVTSYYFLEELYAEKEETPKASYNALSQLYKLIFNAFVDMKETILKETKRIIPHRLEEIKSLLDDPS